MLVLLFPWDRESFLYPKQGAPFTNWSTINNFIYTHTSHYFACLCATLHPCESILVFVQVINTHIQITTNIVTPNMRLVSRCFWYRCIVEINNYVHQNFIMWHRKEHLYTVLDCRPNSLSVSLSKDIDCIIREKNMEVSSGIKRSSIIFITVIATLFSLL